MSTGLRHIATGFEKAFIKSWRSWDDHDATTYTFYNAELQPNMGLPADVYYDYVNIALEHGIIEVYHENDCVCSRKFKLTLEN